MMTHPIIRLQFAQVLQRRLKLGGAEAVRLAQALLEDMNKADLDVIKGIWMGPDETTRSRFSWDDIPAMADEFLEERGGVAPWKVYEKETSK